jgi:endonuclease G, mitochondrial
MSRSLQAIIIVSIMLATACKKSSDVPAAPSTASYSLVASGGNCSNTTVIGSYVKGVTLDATNKITVQVNVTSVGKYSIVTPLLDAISFSDSGTFSSTGIQTITLTGTGTPAVATSVSFPITTGTSSCSFTVTVTETPPPTVIGDNDNMLFGNPSNAAPITDSANNYLMRKLYYAVSYSRDRGKPNWVSWHLYSPDLGTTPRQDDFRADFTLPAGWYQVNETSYSGSGFDRGHNCPSADRTSSVPANSATFLMTNMIPQAPVNNQQTWAGLEDSLRRLVNFGFEVYIIMGNYGVGGTGSNGPANTINGGHVTVPSNIWKVAVIIPNGNNDTTRVDANTRIISVNVPNLNTVSPNWKLYRTSIDAIEAATGYDILSRLPASLQAVIEAKVDNL